MGELSERDIRIIALADEIQSSVIEVSRANGMDYSDAIKSMYNAILMVALKGKAHKGYEPILHLLTECQQEVITKYMNAIRQKSNK